MFALETLAWSNYGQTSVIAFVADCYLLLSYTLNADVIFEMIDDLVSAGFVCKSISLFNLSKKFFRAQFPDYGDS